MKGNWDSDERMLQHERVNTLFAHKSIHPEHDGSADYLSVNDFARQEIQLKCRCVPKVTKYSRW